MSQDPQDLKERALVVDVSGKDGATSRFLAEILPAFTFEVQEASEPLLDQGYKSLPADLQGKISFKQHNLFQQQFDESSSRIFAYIVKAVLRNLCDDDCIKLLRGFIPVLERSPKTVVLVNDLVSPRSGTFAPHVEQAYRRRDVTLMTMHNVKQRTENEWLELLQKGSPHFKVTDPRINLPLIQKAYILNTHTGGFHSGFYVT
jgi:hypothetical protein